MNKYLLILLLPVNAFAQIVVTNGLTQQIQSPASGQIVGKIKLKNIGKKPEPFIASKNDIIFKCGSNTSFSETETHDRSLNDWIEFDIDEKVLSPNEEFDLIYRVNVPNDATSGTYWTAIMVENGDPIPGAGLYQITSKTRYAVQIILNKGSFVAPNLIYKNVVINKGNANSKTIKLELENTGFFSVTVKTQLELYNDKGKKVQTIQGDIKSIYPNRCNNYEIEVKNMTPGKYDGVIMSDTGKKIYGSNVSIIIE